MNFAELKTEFKRILSYEMDVGSLPTGGEDIHLNRAYERAVAWLEYPPTLSNLTNLTLGTDPWIDLNQLSPSPKIILIKRAWYKPLGGNWTSLAKESFRPENYPFANVGIPQNFWSIGSVLFLYPKPAGSFDLKLELVQMPAALSANTDIPVIPFELHHTLAVYGAYLWTLPYSGLHQIGLSFKQMAEFEWQAWRNRMLRYLYQEEAPEENLLGAR